MELRESILVEMGTKAAPLLGGLNLAKAGVAGFVAFGINELRKFDAQARVTERNWQRAVAEIGTLTNATTTELAALRKESSALSTQFGLDFEKVARARYNVVSAGFTKISDSQRIMTASAKLAVGGLTEIDQAGAAVVTMLNSYGFAADRANEMADKLFATVRVGVTTMPELASSIGDVASTAHAAGVSVNELLGLLATITKGLGPGKTSEAVTSINALLTQFIRRPGEMRAAGLDLSQGLVPVMEKIAKLADKDLEKLAQLVPEIRGLKAALIGSSGDAQNLASDIQAIATSAGAADVAAKRMMETMDVLEKRRAAVRARGQAAWGELTGAGPRQMVESEIGFGESWARFLEKTGDSTEELVGKVREAETVAEALATALGGPPLRTSEMYDWLDFFGELHRRITAVNAVLADFGLRRGEGQLGTQTIYLEYKPQRPMPPQSQLQYGSLGVPGPYDPYSYAKSVSDAAARDAAARDREKAEAAARAAEAARLYAEAVKSATAALSQYTASRRQELFGTTGPIDARGYALSTRDKLRDMGVISLTEAQIVAAQVIVTPTKGGNGDYDLTGGVTGGRTEGRDPNDVMTDEEREQVERAKRNISLTQELGMAAVSSLEGAVAQGLGNAFAEAFNAADSAWGAFAARMLTDLTMAIAKATVFRAIMTFMGLPVVGFEGGGYTGSNSFAWGGYTGANKPGMGGVAGVVHEREFVLRRQVVEAIGVENLQRVNATGGGVGDVHFHGGISIQGGGGTGYAAGRRMAWNAQEGLATGIKQLQRTGALRPGSLRHAALGGA